MFDVGTALATAGDHEGTLHEYLAAVVQWCPLGADRDARRERISETQAVGEAAKCVQSDMGDDTGPTGFHLHAIGAGSVHLGSTLLVEELWLRTPSVSLTRRAIPRLSAGQVTLFRE